MAAEQLESYAAGQTIFNEGEPGNGMYIVRSGQVELRGGNVRREVVGESEFFGEMALIDNEPRSAGAIALTDCQLTLVDARRFEFMVQQTPFFALQVMRTLARRLRQMNQA
jgi:CRP/FNR family transcriptional regulator, cyclic AMP receptor protein